MFFFYNDRHTILIHQFFVIRFQITSCNSPYKLLNLILLNLILFGFLISNFVMTNFDYDIFQKYATKNHSLFIPNTHPKTCIQNMFSFIHYLILLYLYLLCFLFSKIYYSILLFFILLQNSFLSIILLQI